MLKDGKSVEGRWLTDVTKELVLVDHLPATLERTRYGDPQVFQFSSRETRKPACYHRGLRAGHGRGRKSYHANPGAVCSCCAAACETPSVISFAMKLL